MPLFEACYVYGMRMGYAYVPNNDSPNNFMLLMLWAF